MMYEDALEAQRREEDGTGPDFEPQAKPLFDDAGRYIGEHKPGITFENCPHSRHWDGCLACEQEIMERRNPKKAAAEPAKKAGRTYTEGLQRERSPRIKQGR